MTALPGRAGVRATAAIEAERVPGTDRSRLPVLRSSPPITLRRTGPDQVHLVGTTAGPVGGDELDLDIRVADGATLRVASVAASLAYPGPSGRRSSFRVTADVGPGARLAWEPEPTVLVRGCDHEATVQVRLEENACLVWREVVVLGRHDEPSGSLLQRLRVDRGGRPLLRNDLAVGPAWPASLGPAGVGVAGSVATALVVAPGAGALTAGSDPAVAASVRTAVLPLAEDAALVCVLAAAAAPAIAALDGTLDRMFRRRGRPSHDSGPGSGRPGDQIREEDASGRRP